MTITFTKEEIELIQAVVAKTINDDSVNMKLRYKAYDTLDAIQENLNPFVFNNSSEEESFPIEIEDTLLRCLYTCLCKIWLELYVRGEPEYTLFELKRLQYYIRANLS